MSLPSELLPPPPVNPAQVVNNITAGNVSQSDMVKLLAGGRRRKRRQRQRQSGGADVVEVPKIPVAYNDGGTMQKIYGETVLNNMQSTANAAGDSAIKSGGSRKTKRQRRRKSRKSRRSKKSRKTRR